MHPTTATLMALADGELDARSAVEADRHLETCERCREEVARIRREEALIPWQFGSGRIDPAVLAENRRRVFAAIDAWKASRPRPEELRRRVCAQVEIYLGSEIGSKLAREAPDEELVTRAHHLLAAFLGRNTAARIVGRMNAGPAGPTALAGAF